MSFVAHMWSSGVAPVADVYEYAVLNRMADEVDESGEGCGISAKTIARDIMASDRQVRRALDAMLERKLIGVGDQARVAYLRADRRPVVYDLLIPAKCFADLERTNERRAAQGRPPITPQNRPVQGPPPAEALRKVRADQGTKRPKKLADTPEEQAAIDAAADAPQGPDQVQQGQPSTGGLEVTPSTGGLLVQNGVTTSPERGDCKSTDPGFDLDPGTSDPSPPTPRSDEPAAADVLEVGDEGGDSPKSNPERRTVLDDLVDELVAAGKWSPTATREVLEELAARGVDRAEIGAVMREAAAGAYGPTHSPRRMLSWWPSAADRPHVTAPRPERAYCGKGGAHGVYPAAGCPVCATEAAEKAAPQPQPLPEEAVQNAQGLTGAQLARAVAGRTGSARTVEIRQRRGTLSAPAKVG